MKKEILKKLEKMNRTMTIYDVMKHAGVSRQTIYNWIDKGLGYMKNEAGELRFSMTEVDQFLEERRNERQLLDPKNRKAVKIDGKLFQELMDRAPGKQHVKIVDGIVKKGLEEFDPENPELFGKAKSMIKIEKELFKKLLHLSVDMEKPVYKIVNSVISLGLKDSASDQSGQ